MKIPVTWMLIICLVPFLTGCEDLSDHTLTGRLWASDTTGPNHYSPATPPNLKLFQDLKHRDILVQYNELSDNDGKIRRRTYLLDANEDRILAAQKPRFLDLHAADHLEPIPVETSSASAGDSSNAVPLRAVLSSDGQEFTLISTGQTIGPHHLPVYAGAADHFDRFMLTPITVAGDAAICGAIIAAVAGVVYLLGGFGPTDTQPQHSY